ncbi:MAG: hypothetical protein Q9186_004046 [Xanthomendoza sp. 1 TL-2023]
MAGPNNGAAIFSTELGRYAPRKPASLPARIILRSCPDEDMEAKITELQAKFTDQCKALKSPIANLYDYFDNYDQDLHGSMFLRAVLEEICGRNLMRRQSIVNYTQQWSQLNPMAFHHVLGLGLDAFTADDMEAFGEEFLRDALGELQLQKLKYDDAVAHVRNRDHFPVRVPPQLTIRAPFPIITQQEQQVYPTVQRQFSDPSSLHSVVVPPQPPGPVPASTGATPIMSQVFPSRAPYPPSGQYHGPTKDELSKPPQLSKPLYPPGRTEYHANTTHANSSRIGFPDMFLAAPPRGMAPGPHPYYHLSPGTRGYNQPLNKLRSGPKTKGPVYIGPSNDARILEYQGVPKGRAMNRNHPNSAGSQMYNSRQYLPSQPNQSSWTPFSPSGPPLPPPPPPQGSGSSAITPSSIAKGMVTTSADHGPPIILGEESEGLQQMGQRDLPRPHVGNLHGTGKELTSSAQKDAHPREVEVRKQESYAPGGRMHAESTLPHMVHGSSVASAIGSPTLRRFSNAADFSVKRYNGQYQNTQGSRGHRFEMDDCPVSDRKIWIGGLPPKTDIGVLAQVLKPYEPFELNKLLVSSKNLDSRSDYAGFTFAEYDTSSSTRCNRTDPQRFESPQRATDAIEALNGRIIESLHCRLFMKPARINRYTNPTGSPQKNSFGLKGYAGRQNPNDLGDGYGTIATDRAPQVALTRTTESPSRRDKLSDEDPLVGKYSQDSDTKFGHVSACKPHEVQNTQQGTQPAQAVALKAHNVDGSDGLQSKEGSTSDSTAPSAIKLAVDSTAPVALELPSSPSTKTNQAHTSKERPHSPKVPHPRVRKEMLSNLRTERPNDTPSKAATHTTSPYEDRQTETSSSALPPSTETNSQIGQAGTLKSLDISASDLKDEVDYYAASPSDESGEGLSRVHSVSTRRRRLSSGSVNMTTDPTSYAQSECGTGGVRTPVMLEADAHMSKASPTSTSSNDQRESIVHSQADPPRTQPLKTDLRTVDEAFLGSRIRVASPPATIKVQLEKQEASATPGSFPIASVPTTAGVSSTDLSRKVDTVVRPGSKSHLEPRPIDLPHVETLSRPGKSMETSEQPSKEEDVLPIGKFALAHGGISEDGRAMPMRDINPSTSGPSPKPGLPRDPKTLVAIPRLLPVARIKPHIGKLDAQTRNPSIKPRVSTESLDSTKSAVTEPNSVIKKQQDKLVPVSAPFAHAEEGQAPMSLPIKEDVLAPQSMNRTDQLPFDAATDGQGRSEGLDENCDLASVPDSVATLRGDTQDSVQEIPRSSPTAVIDLEKDVPAARSAEQQPIIQQKKRKGKKGKKPKRPKPSQESSANGSSPTHSQSNVKEESRILARVPKAETPYLADDNTPLPQPSFVRQNHSSMRSRKVGDSKNLQSIWKSEDNSSTTQIPETYANISSNSAARSQGLIVFIFLSESSDADLPQDGNNQATEAGPLLLPEVDQRTFSQEEQAARLRKLDEVAQERQLAPIGELLKALAIVAPQGSRAKNNGEDKPSNPSLDSSPDTLAGLSEPKIIEILSDDDDQSPSLPSTQSREQEPSLPLGPDGSVPRLFNETVSAEYQDFRNTDDVERSVDRPGNDHHEDHVVTSFPSSRDISPERGRDRSLPRTKGLAISVTHPQSVKSENVLPSRQQTPSVKSENVSPSRKQGHKPMCWSEAVIKSTSPSIQMGDIVEITSKKPEGESKGLLGKSVVQKSGSRDPWRVPSAEQEWGASSKSKSKPFTETSTQKK